MTQDKFVFTKTESEDFFTLNDAQLNELQIEETLREDGGMDVGPRSGASSFPGLR